MHSHSFAPLESKHTKTLILGSLPGVESLRKQQYYAHPRNCFWPLIHEVLELPDPLEYEWRIQTLRNHEISLWDVCRSAFRPGSLDSRISRPVANELDAFIDRHPELRVIAFNGKKPAALFRQNFSFRDHITYLTLLSTSPANASFSMNAKLEDWKRIRMV